MHVAVLLSTFNGEPWLVDQLDSVLSQTHADLTLVVRDDGSTDGTHQVLAEYASRDPRVRWSAGPNLGAARSFLALLANVGTGQAAAFCDQDDVWEPDHLERALLALGREPTGRPTLWCSDVLVCDEGLTPLRRHGGLRVKPSFTNALVENVATGCTIVLNGAAVDLLKRAAPDSPVMHDAWCYLVVAAMGRVLYDPCPSVRYRLHPGNTMGLSDGWRRSLVARSKRAWRGPHVGAWSRQAQDLEIAYGLVLSDPVCKELRAFLAGRDSVTARLRYAVVGAAHRQQRRETVLMKVLQLLGRV